MKLKMNKNEEDKLAMMVVDMIRQGLLDANAAVVVLKIYVMKNNV